MLYVVKYTPGVGPRVQEACNKEVRSKPRSLKLSPDIFKIQEIHNEAVDAYLWYISYQFWTHRMTYRALEILLQRMSNVSDQYKTQGMCGNAV